MMDFVKFPLESGGFVYIEAQADDIKKGGVVRAGHSIPGEAEARQTFEAAIESLSPLASSIVSRIISISNPPDEAVVEFGLTLKADSGFIITKVGGEANFKVSLKWAKEMNKSG